MESRILATFRNILKSHKDNILEWLGSESADCDRCLGCEPGSNERSEIIQNHLVVREIDLALEQIACGEFGKCSLCKGDVEEERLALDFTTSVCLGHFSESELKDLEKDLELAARVQQQLFPQRVPVLPGIQIAVRAEPARIVGGDYVDFFRFRDTLQGIAIADVMGKGLPASMLMSNLQASLRILGPDNFELDKTAQRLNELFRYNLKTIRFISVFLAAIDVESQTLYYCNAGHNPPILMRQNTNSFEYLQPTGPAIGILTDPVFHTKQVQYQPGDIFLLYTDGLTESHNGTAEFGEENLCEFLHQNYQKNAQQILTGLFKAIKAYSIRDLDDLTAVLIKID